MSSLTLSFKSRAFEAHSTKYHLAFLVELPLDDHDDDTPHYYYLHHTFLRQLARSGCCLSSSGTSECFHLCHIITKRNNIEVRSWQTLCMVVDSTHCCLSAPHRRHRPKMFGRNHHQRHNHRSCFNHRLTPCAISCCYQQRKQMCSACLVAVSHLRRKKPQT